MSDSPAPAPKAVGPLDESRRVFYELQPGDRVEVDHEVKVGLKRWRAKTVGTLVAKRRERRGLHFDRNPDDKVYSDTITLRLDDGSLSTITLDEFTVLRRLEPAGA